MTFTQDLLEFLEATQAGTGVDLDEVVAKATAQFGARVRANRRVGKKLTPSKYLKKYGSSWQNLKNETELEGDDLLEKDNSEWYKRGDKAPPKKMTKKDSLQAKKDFIRAAWERKGVTTKEEVEQIAELKADTYGSYIKKAAWDAGDHASAATAEIAKNKPDGNKILERRKKELKRHAGISNAVNLLTKKVSEEVEPINELDAKTMERAFTARRDRFRAANSTYNAISRNTPTSLKHHPEASAARKEMNDSRKKADRTLWHMVKKMTKKEVSEGVEQIDETSHLSDRARILQSALKDMHSKPSHTVSAKEKALQKKTHDAKLTDDDYNNPSIAGTRRRKGGIVNKKEFRSTNEEVEQIDELSNPTLERYISRVKSDKKHVAGLIKSGKSGRDYAKALLSNPDYREQARGKRELERSDEFDSGLRARSRKRTQGIKTAEKKLSAANEEVKLSKGTKKDKRPTPVDKALPTMPAGMNAGMRMMPEEVLAELNKDTVYNAYKERYTLAKAHDTVGNKADALKNAAKALKHADYHGNHEANSEKYAKVAAARETIAKRTKKVTEEMVEEGMLADKAGKRAADAMQHAKERAKQPPAPKVRGGKKTDAEIKAEQDHEWKNMTLAQKRREMGGEYGGDRADD